ncbi:MAG: nucleotidyltransferase domain-containing protein [Chitinophagaceae bacterium]|nr:MAG: nucleotidyltransferase domain-containing protein [Chitinophagaceae bacterium]
MISYITNNFGLREKDMQYMMQLFQSYPAVEKVILYGSRARGDFRLGSDVDLALAGPTISSKDVMRIHSKLEEDSPIPLGFDVVHYDTIENQILKKLIIEEGVFIYQKQEKI